MIIKNKSVDLLSFLSSREFPEDVNFQSCRISSHDFCNAVSGLTVNVEFRSCVFDEPLISGGAQFNKHICFEECEFKGVVNFDDSKFVRGVTFNSCEFNENVYLRRCVFSYDCFANFCCFNKSLNFRDSSFHGYADFSSSIFKSRIKLMGCAFGDEIRLSKCEIQYFKDVDTHDIDFTGSVLNDATFWKTSIIKNCKFRDCTLISVSFSEKEIVNCDFTGAVLKSVSFNSSVFDKETVEKTKFIYTDFTINENKSEKRAKFIPRLTSRVPLNGEFDDEQNKGFTFLDCIESTILWSRSFSVPQSLRSALLGYFQFFTDYIEVTQNISIDFSSLHEGGKIKAEYRGSSKIDVGLILTSLKSYVEGLLVDFCDLKVDFSKSKCSEIDQELFSIRYESAISNLKNQLSYTQLILKKEEEKNTQLLDVIASLNNDPGEFFMGRKKCDTGGVYNITSINEMHNSQLQQASPSSSQSSKYSLDKAKVDELVNEIKMSIFDLNLQMESRVALQRVIADLEKNIVSNRPDNSSIAEGLKSVRNILEGTTGSLVATGFLSQIAMLLG